MFGRGCLPFGNPVGCSAETPITHRFQHLLGWNAAIHKPGAAEFPILFFDTIQKFLQCCGISGISRIYLVGYGKTFRRRHQCHDHLNTIRTFVTAVSKTFPHFHEDKFYYPTQPQADRFQNKCSSNRTAERHTSHQTDCSIALLKTETARRDA